MKGLKFFGLSDIRRFEKGRINWDLKHALELVILALEVILNIS